MLYHSDIFLPRRITKLCPTGIIRLTYSDHAINASNTDRYGKINLPNILPITLCEIIEVESREVKRESGDFTKIVKIVCRLPDLTYPRWVKTTEFDLCFVIVPVQKDIWHVKTVWINERNDTHKTLNPTPYVPAPKGFKKTQKNSKICS
jgi:hypothetical protein